MFDIFRRQRKKTSLESTHQQLVYRINQIRIERIGRVFSPDKGNIWFKTPRRSIRDYVQYLKQLTVGLKSDKEISTFFFSNDITEVFVRDWFLDSSGYYLDTVTEAKLFQDQAKEFLNAFIALEQKQDSVSQRKVFQISPVVSQLKIIIDALIGITEYEGSSSVLRTEL